MSTQTHDQFTLLYEDENTKVLHEFKAAIADDVVQHLVDFLKGCGYIESNIFEVMQELSQMYFDAQNVEKFVMSTGLQVQQQTADID
jgi:DNA-directed RNA polymerase specialized sigma54-like protein